MPFVPAVCYVCHTMFSSGLFVKDIRVNLSGIEAEPCPNCSSNGRVLGGMYEFIDYTLKVLKEKNRTIFELNILYDTLSMANELNIPASQLEEDIKRDFPEFQDLLLLLPGTKADYKLCLNLIIQVLLAVIEMSFQSDRDSHESDDFVTIVQNIKVNQAIDQIYTQNTGVKKRFL